MDRVARCESVLETIAIDAIQSLAERYPEERSLRLDWSAIEDADAALADDLLRDPERMFEHFEDAMHEVAREHVDGSMLAEAHVRVRNLPDADTYTVGAQRASETFSLVAFEGQLTKRTEVNPKLHVGVFECLRCSSRERVEQGFGNIASPQYCEPCSQQMGRPVGGEWHLDKRESEWTDHQLIRLQQPPEEAIDGATANIDIHLLDDLCGQLEGGQRVTVTGEFRPVPNNGRTVHNKVVIGNGYELNEEPLSDTEYDAYAEDIEALASDPDVFDVLTAAIAPGHQGNWHIKEAVTLQLFGGWPRYTPDGTYHRGDSHILLVGDPGVGKTVLLDAASEVAPRAAQADGTGSSAAGLTAALTKDDFADGDQWSIEAGTIVRANKGLACVDELDKGDTSDLDALHTALESQEVIVSKGGRHAHLPAQTALLGAGNPTGGHFDPTRDFASQVRLQSPLLSRFDCIFVMREHVQEDLVREVAEHIVDSRTGAGKLARGEDLPEDERSVVEAAIDQDLLTAYIAYAKQTCQPLPSTAQKERLREFYVDLKTTLPNRYLDDDGPPLPVTARKLDAAMRLAEASARTRLSETVDDVDVERAERIIQRSLADVGIEPGDDAAIGRAPQNVEISEVGIQ